MNNSTGDLLLDGDRQARSSPADRSWGANCGVLVVGHGTADTIGADETHRVAQLVDEALPGVPVALGFLEVIGPTIGEALGRLAAAGCREVIAAPLLLFEAGHAKRDVPEAIAAPAAELGIVVRRAGPLGCHPAIVELSGRRRGEAIAGRAEVAPQATTLVMVGRGSSDPTAPAQLADFTERSLVTGPRPGRVLAGFVAAARPSVSEALLLAVEPTAPSLPPPQRIIVQPHLLFRGHVEEEVAAAVSKAQAARPDLEWILAPRLGPDPLVARAVLERAAEMIAAVNQTG